MRTFGDFVAAAVAGGRRARFGAAATDEQASMPERVITVAAILAAALLASRWAKQY